MIQHFDQKKQKFENFDFATNLFRVEHRMSSYISISFVEGFWCPRVCSRTQKIVREIAVDDGKSMNFT